MPQWSDKFCGSCKLAKDMNNEQLVATITKSVLRQLQEQGSRTGTLGAKPTEAIPVGISNRHLHLSQADASILFGPSAKLTVFKDLSQPGQFACSEKVLLVGPKGVIEGVRVLGPTRSQTQVEIAPSDAIKLGIKPPIRDSGDLIGSAGLTIVGPAGAVTLQEGVIIAARHIHMHTADAARFGVVDKQRVSIRYTGPRGVTFHEVLIRVSSKFAIEMHLDIDEANAGCINNGDKVELVK